MPAPSPGSGLDSAPEWLTIEEAADLLMVHRTTVHRWLPLLKRHGVRCWEPGPRKRYIDRVTLVDYVERRTRGEITE
jgi:excisionase family DNA binding protein